MIKHLFKMMWNRKKRNLLLITEMLVSFLVLFAITATLFGWGLHYFQPLGFDYSNLWVLRVGWENKVQGQTENEVREAMVTLEREMKSFDEVTGVCWAYSNTPYSNSTWKSGMKWKGQHLSFHYLVASDSYADVLDIPIREGSWFSPENQVSSAKPVVINTLLKEQLFEPGAPVAGQVITEEGDDPDKYLVVGVVDHFRYKGELDSENPILFRRLSLTDTVLSPPSRAIIRVKPGTGVLFEKKLTDRLSQMVPNWSLRIEEIPELRDNYFRTRYTMLLTPGILGGFLIFNVALGLFGVIWYSINRRRPELGLRRALGASFVHINQQIIGESIVMTTFALIVGILIASQIAILSILGETVSTVAYVLAIISSVILIYGLVIICAWYPAQLAGRVQPAEALHDE